MSLEAVREREDRIMHNVGVNPCVIQAEPPSFSAAY
jgi:hypothetical protein